MGGCRCRRTTRRVRVIIIVAAEGREIWITSSRKETTCLLKILASHLSRTPKQRPILLYYTIPLYLHVQDLLKNKRRAQLVNEDNTNTIVIKYETSDREERSDNPDNKNYTDEEPLPLVKYRQARFSDIVIYSTDRLQETLISPPDILDNKIQGGLSYSIYRRGGPS
jgi:hypothetical protein